MSKRKGNALQSGMVLTAFTIGIIVFFCTGCGLVNPGSKGYFAMQGDSNGVSSFVQAFSHQDKYWTQRKLEEEQETVRQTSPSWIQGLFSSGSK